MRYPRFYGYGVILISLLFMAGCGGGVVLEDDSPRLLEEYTLSPSTPVVSPSAVAERTVVSELFPVIHVTAPAQFVIVTPTLPPSKTPSATPSPFLTPTITDTAPPTVENTPSATFGAIIPVQPTAGDVPRIMNCPIAWGYLVPITDCPRLPYTVHFGVFQSFEKDGYSSYMFWIEPKTIYVVYGDGQYPHWREFEDTFQIGLDPVDEPGLDYPPEFAPERPSLDRWQPRRGFGKLWRDNVTPLDIMARIGWADIRYEIPYTMIVQYGQNGVMYMSDPYGRVFGLVPNGNGWTLTNKPLTASPVKPTASSPLPLPTP